jgi:hypothetical protein
METINKYWSYKLGKYVNENTGQVVVNPPDFNGTQSQWCEQLYSLFSSCLFNISLNFERADIPKQIYEMMLKQTPQSYKIFIAINRNLLESGDTIVFYGDNTVRLNILDFTEE